MKLSTEIAAELYKAVQIAPSLRRNWSRRFHTVIIAYDACLSGGAVVYANTAENMAGRYAHLNARTMFDLDGKADREKQATRSNALRFDDPVWKLAIQLPLSHISAHID